MKPKPYENEDREAIERKRVNQEKKEMTEQLIQSIIASRVSLARLSGPIQKK